VWDVSHQCYPHKILTGRRERFGSLRQTGGLCGFTHPDESPYDLFHTGHAGTSISLALGLALGMAHESDPPHVDQRHRRREPAARASPSRALNHAGASGLRVVVILNDNEWSISKSVGSLARYLSRIRRSRRVQRAHQEIHNLLTLDPGDRREGRSHARGRGRGDAPRAGARARVRGLGVTYVGPIDGHDVLLLVENLERLKRLDGAVLLHTLTDKGRGHPHAPTHPERVHGVKAAAPKVSAPNRRRRRSRPQATPAKSAAGPAYTKAFADALLKLAERDVRVHALTAGMPSGTGLERSPSASPSASTTPASPSSTPSRWRPAWRRAACVPSPRSTRPSCSAATTRSSRRSRCRTCR
jgi:1-deoxy-D-xylulose-5-phosphate synthase